MSYFDGHNKVPLRRLEPAIPQYQVKHSTNDPGDCILNIDPDQAEQSMVHDLDSKSFGTLEFSWNIFLLKKKSADNNLKITQHAQHVQIQRGTEVPPPP